MSQKKTEKLSIHTLKKGQVVWSNYFKTYVQFVEREEDGDYIFKFLAKKGYCILYGDDIREPDPLIKELL